jgi:hypothetical protein
MVVDTLGSDFDTMLAVYGGSVSESTLLVTDDDSGTNQTSRVSFSATASRTYYIAVVGFGSAAGNIHLNWQFTAVPANDNFSNAITLSGNSGTTSGSNAGATRETADPFSSSNTSVWWRWTASSNGTMVVDTLGSDFDTLLAVYGGSVSESTLLATDDDSGANRTSRVSFSATASRTYYIAVVGFASVAGNIRLNWQFTASLTNDTFSNATTLSGNSGTTNGSNIDATSETGEPTLGNLNSVWWRWTAPAAGTAVFDTSGSDFDTELGVYSGNAVNALSIVAGNDDYGDNLTSRVSFSVAAGTTYRIRVTGFGTSTGQIRLNWQFTATDTPAPTTFTWQSWRQREGENNNVP